MIKLNAGTVFAIVISVIIIVLCGVGYWKYTNAIHKISELETSLQQTTLSLDALKNDVSNMTTHTETIQNNRVEYNNTIKEIIKERDPVYINTIKDDPLKYQEKLNSDFSNLFNDFTQLSEDK